MRRIILALPLILKPGSLVFTPPNHPVDLRDFKFRANWRRPYGPRSSISRLDDHPVVHRPRAYAKWPARNC
jgi:hypothetical protein